MSVIEEFDCRECGGHFVKERKHRGGKPSTRCWECLRALATKRAREWYATNRERGAAARRAYAQRNPDEARRYGREWAARNRQSSASNWQTYNARKMAAFIEHVDRLVVYKRDGGLCGICGEVADRANFHVDHIVPLVRGGEHSYANCQTAHPHCNCVKNDRLVA